MKLLATLSAFLFSGIISAAPLHDMVLFGDSLSDKGNLYEVMKHQLPQSPPYFNGRFSNGPIWIEHLIASYFPNHSSSHLLDYAYGGAGVLEEDGDDTLFTLRKEIDTYLLGHQDKANPESLFIIWIGANNYLALPSDIDQTVTSVTQGITHGLERLAEKGAKHILVINLPDLGKTPAAYEFGSAAELGLFATQHNKLMYESVNDLKQKYPEVEWLFFDMYTGFNDVLEHPEHYGFTNIKNTCVDLETDGKINKSVLKMVAHAKAKVSGDACEGFLFFDLVHPTAMAHKILAQKAREMLDRAGVQFSE